MAGPETIPQQLGDISAQVATVNQTLAAVTLQLSRIGPANDAASLDALARAVAGLQSDVTTIKGVLGLDGTPTPTPTPAPAAPDETWTATVNGQLAPETAAPTATAESPPRVEDDLAPSSDYQRA